MVAALEISEFAELCYLWCGHESAGRSAKVNVRAKDGPGQRGGPASPLPLLSLSPSKNTLNLQSRPGATQQKRDPATDDDATEQIENASTQKKLSNNMGLFDIRIMRS